MTVAVLTIVAGRQEHLQRLLGGLARQSRPADRIIVVDLAGDAAAVTRGRAERIAGPPRSGPSLDLAAGRNAAAAAADCDHLVFLDVDILPAPDLVARYDEVLTTHPAALACGPVRYLREGWAHEVDDTPDTDRLDALSDAPAARPVPDDVELSMAHELFWSLSFGVTRATWDAIGGFDERYRGYGAEDTDLGLRARALGIPLAWFRGGTGYHQWHPPSRLDPDHLDALVANARRFREQWGVWPMAGWFDELDRLGRVRFDAARDVLEVTA